MTYYDLCIQVLYGAMLVAYLLALGLTYADIELMTLAIFIYRVYGYAAQ